MLINLKEINYYFLTTNKNQQRVDHNREMLKDYKKTEINPPMDLKENNMQSFKQKSGSIGYYNMINQGLKDQDKNKPFTPFITLEDDVNIYKEFPVSIQIPDDADIVYVGISSFGWSGTNHEPLYCTNIDDDYVRIYNMLSTHAIMFCTALGAATYQRALVENYYTILREWDIPFANTQPYLNVYARRIPLFYQYGKLNGQELPTKITLKNGIVNYESNEYHYTILREWDIPFANTQPYLNVYARRIPLFYQYGKLNGQELPTKITLKNGIVNYESNEYHYMSRTYVEKEKKSSALPSPFLF